MMRSRKGFTLVEVLLVCMLISMLTATVISGISGGLRVWKKLSGQENKDQWTLLAFHQMRQDIRNARQFQLLPYKGSYKQFAFPSVIKTELRNGDVIEELGRIAYYRDAKYDRLCRSEVPFRHAERKKITSECSEVLGNVAKVKFSYLLGDSESQTRKWVSQWTEVFPPIAVKLDVDIENKDGEKETSSVLVSIPISMGAMLGHANAAL